MVADPAHLQKSGKSLWQSHLKVELPKKTLDKWGLKYKYAEWKWIVKLIEFDEKYEKSIAPHLKRWVLSTSSYDKMDCKPALAIFNVKTAQALEYMVKHEGWGEEALTAALYVRLWARWFQIIGAYTPLHGFNKKFPIDRKEKEDFILFFMDFYANCKYAENHKSLWQNQKYVLCSSATCLWVADQMLSQPDFEIFLPGYLLGNSVENLHTSVRNVNPLPTPLLYKRILKGIALSQMFSENVKKSNYQLDPGEGWMVNLKDFKKIKAKDPETMVIIELFDEAEHWRAQDFNEDVITSFIGGGVLASTIVACNCVTCINFWVETTETSNHVLNALIAIKEYAPDAMTRPSDVGHSIFLHAEQLFLFYRDKEIKKTGLIDAFVTLIGGEIMEKFDNIPQCHFKVIIKKLMTGKWHHYSKFLNRDFIEANKDEIENEANASKTTKANALVKGLGQQNAEWQQLADDLPSFSQPQEMDDGHRGHASSMDYDEPELPSVSQENVLEMEDSAKIANGVETAGGSSVKKAEKKFVFRKPKSSNTPNVTGFDNFPRQLERSDSQDDDNIVRIPDGLAEEISDEEDPIVETAPNRTQSFPNEMDFINFCTQSDKTFMDNCKKLSSDIQVNVTEKEDGSEVDEDVEMADESSEKKNEPKKFVFKKTN